MINIKIFSKHNFLVCGKDFEEELCDFCYVDVFLEDSEKCYLKFFPLFAQATSIPFCIYISVNANQIECDANNIKIYIKTKCSKVHNIIFKTTDKLFFNLFIIKSFLYWVKFSYEFIVHFFNFLLEF